jgi:hypothetical protein
MNNNAIYPSPLETLLSFAICVVAGFVLAKAQTWSVNKARKEATQEANQAA